MPQANTWTDYLTAAQRKLEVADYHRDCLARELASSGLAGSDGPPVSVQAHFEGVVFSVIAAVDQVAQAINSARGFGLAPARLVEGTFPVLGESLPAVRDWYAEKIGRDVRSIRTRAVHYSYAKNPSAHRWVVESVGQSKDYGGSRELLAYATAGVEYGHRLGTLLGDITRELANGERSA